MGSGKSAVEADSKQLGRKRRASSVSLFEPLCESEMIISMVGGVYFDSLIGTAACTNFRLVWVPTQKSVASALTLSVPLLSIQRIKRLLQDAHDAGTISVSSHWQTFTLSFRRLVEDQMFQGFDDMFQTLRAGAFPDERQLGERGHISDADAEGTMSRLITDAIALDANRLGLDSIPALRFCTLNCSADRYKFSATYPHSFLVPAAVTDDALRESAAFRTKGRLPAICWVDAATGACIARSSQPMTGVTRRRCHADETLIQQIANCSSNCALVIFDCRPHLNAVANSVTEGAGYESKEYYNDGKTDSAVEFEFLGIPNIHAVRKGMRKVAEEVSSERANGPSNWLGSLFWGAPWSTWHAF